jgi:integrase/recombinase XerD
MAVARRRSGRAQELGADWESTANDFLREKRRANVSQATIDVYGMCLTGPRTDRWRLQHGVETTAELTDGSLRTLELELAAAGLSPSTVHIYHRTLKTFARWCEAEGYLLGQKSLTLKGPRVPDRAPETFTSDEEKRLLAATRHPRDRFIMEFMFHTGLRRAEVCAVSLDDLMTGPEGSWLRVRQGKGRKDRIVPLDTPDYRLSRKITAFVRDVRPTQSRDRHLFLGLNRDARGDYPPMTAQALKTLLRRLGQETGIHCHAHKFRHTFATRAAGAGVDVFALQQALGHTTLAMTTRYVQHSPNSLINAWMARRD